MMDERVMIFPQIDRLSDFAAEKFIEIGVEAIEKRGRFSVALAGGSTPQTLYRLLTGEKYKNQIDWKKVFFFFGDERNVAPEAGESNFRAARENLLEPLQIRTENIFRWQTERDDAAEAYSQEIKKFFALEQNRLPRFDLILLGMGADGHTASLFPFTAALDETEKIAFANPVEKLETVRLTLTFPVINNAANIIFLITGADKAEALKEVLKGDFQPRKFPAQSVAPESGSLFWLVDEPAAKLMTSENS